MEHLSFSENSPRRPSRLFIKAAEKKQDIMGEKTVEEQREAQLRLYEALPISPAIAVLPVELAGIPCEWVLRPSSHSEKIIVYLHGGGWVTGSLEISRPTAAHLAEYAPFKVLSVDYRLAPEHPYPAGLDDCYAVWKALLEEGYRPENIALFGDSAGGNLCLALIHRLLQEGEELPCAMGLASPVTDITDDSAMVRDPLPLAFSVWEGERQPIHLLYAGDQDRSHPFLSPVFGPLGQFPPTLIHVGGGESLAVDCNVFAKKAVEEGADVLCKVWREMFHDFTLVGHTLRESRQSLSELADFYQTHLGRGATPRRPVEETLPEEPGT